MEINRVHNFLHASPSGEKLSKISQMRFFGLLKNFQKFHPLQKIFLIMLSISPESMCESIYQRSNISSHNLLQSIYYSALIVNAMMKITFEPSVLEIFHINYLSIYYSAELLFLSPRVVKWKIEPEKCEFIEEEEKCEGRRRHQLYLRLNSRQPSYVESRRNEQPSN